MSWDTIRCRPEAWGCERIHQRQAKEQNRDLLEYTAKYTPGGNTGEVCYPEWVLSLYL